MRRVITPLITSVSSLFFCGSALAQEQKPEPYGECDGQLADTAAAKGAFQAGTAAFDEADYDRAITYWEDAYRRDCSAHALLKNLARAYELNGMFQHAIVALRTYTKRNPGSGETESLERRMANLETKLAEQSTPAPPHSSEPGATTTPAETDDQSISIDDRFEQNDTPLPERSAIPLFVAGAGAVMAGVGGVLWLGAKNDETQAAEQCADPETRTDCPPAADRAGDEAQEKLIPYAVITWTGAGVLAGGLIWYFVQPPEETANSRFTPAIAPGFAGLSYSGSF